MTSADDPFAAHRELLKTALQATLNGVKYGYAAPLQSQMAISAHDEDVMLPGLLCLATAEAVGGDAAVARAPAVSLVLLGAMSRVFEGIAAEGASELEREWGMPRALNAGDGFYALANTSLIAGTEDMPSEKRLQAISILDAVCHNLSLEMNAGTTRPKALLSGGVALGALFGGAEGSIASQIALGSELTAASLQALSDGARNTLAEAINYTTNRSRR